MGVQKKNRISLVNCLFGGWEKGKEKQSLFQASQDWLATCPGNVDKVQLSWSKQHDKDNCMIDIYGMHTHSVMCMK